MTTPPTITCPNCGEDVQYVPPQEAEPDVGVGAHRGGYFCICGWERENPEPVVDADDSNSRDTQEIER